MLDDVTKKPAEFDEYFDRVLDAIITQQLKPSQKVTENELASRFGITRSAAGNLVEQLKSQKFLIKVSSRCTRVAPLTLMDVKQTFALREMLVPTLLIMAAPDIDQKSVQLRNEELVELTNNYRDESDALAILKVNRKFNLELYGNIRYPLLASWANLLEYMIMRIYWLYVTRHGSLPFSGDLHERLMGAISRDEPKQIEKIILQILSLNSDRVMNSIYSNDEFFRHDLTT